ncbi:MAG: TonB-dependent receptor [Paludibacter sp.]
MGLEVKTIRRTISQDNDVLQSINKSTSEAVNKNSGLNTSLFYKHRFDKKTEHAYEIEASAYTSLRNNNSTNFRNIFFDANNIKLSESPQQFEENETTSRSANTRVNYTLPFDSVYTFNTGLSANYSYNYIDNISTRSNIPFLEYKDLKGSLYAELGKTFKKGNAKIGTRLEVSDVIINSAKPSTYISPLPYVNGQYKFSDKNSLKLNYSRRVFRPSNSQLNPFVSYVDSLTESHGNTGLRPAYRDNFQLTNSIKFGKNKFSGNISPQLFFEYRSGLIQTITKQKENSNTFEKFPVNILERVRNGLEFISVCTNFYGDFQLKREIL